MKILMASSLMLLASCNFISNGVVGGFSSFGRGTNLVMVDPYIEGATMCYDANNNDFCDPGETLSSPADARGSINFSIKLPDNARLIQVDTGVSLEKGYPAKLKLQYKSNPETKFVTPLTTLVANAGGAGNENSILSSGDFIGLGLTVEDLYRNPMNAVENNDPAALELLKLSMAATIALASSPNHSSGTLSEYSAINTIFTSISTATGTTVPNAVGLRAAVIAQEKLLDGFGLGAVTGADIVAAVNTNPGKDIKVFSGTIITNEVLKPSSVRVLNNTVRKGNVPTAMVQVGGVRPGYLVEVFTDIGCSSSVVGTATASGNTVNIPITGLAPGVNNLYAKSYFNSFISDCSTAKDTYEYDNAGPNLTDFIVEPSPIASVITQRPFNLYLEGTFEFGATYRMHLGSTCTSSNVIRTHYNSLVTSGNNIILNTFNLPDGQHTLSLSAVDLSGNESALCKELGSVTIDTTPPARIGSLALVSPTQSVSNQSNIQLLASGVELDADLLLYDNALCSGTPLDIVNAGASSSVPLSRTISMEGLYTFAARVRDLAGNIGQCSNALFYTYDVTPPPIPTAVARSAGIPAIAQGSNVSFVVSGVAANTFVRIYSDASCAAQIGSATATGASVAIPVTFATDGVYNVYANARDVAGNTSGCSSAFASYERDTVAPSPPSSLSRLTPSVSPSTIRVPEIEISGINPDETIRLFTNSTCTQQIAEGVASSSVIVLPTTVLNHGVHNFYARSVDPAGNQSPCSTATANFEVDIIAPGAATFAFAPGSSSPSGNLTPSFNISGLEVGAQLEVFTDNVCSLKVYDGIVASSSEQITIDPIANGPNLTFFYKLTDGVGNARNCGTTGINYTLTRTLNGVASIGGPLRNARITIYGSNSTDCIQHVFANASGAFTFSSVTCDGPYLIKAENAAATLYSVATESDLGGIVNVTPLTELVMNRVYPSINYGSSASIKSFIKSQAANQATIASNIVTQRAAVKAALQDLLNAFSLGSIDIVKSAFTANGSGLDGLLSSITVNPIAGSSDYSLQIKSTTLPITIPASGSITDTLLSTNVGPLVVSDFNSMKTAITNFNNCSLLASSADYSNVQSCIINQTSVDFLHDMNTREDFANGVGEEKFLYNYFVEYINFHLMDHYVDNGSDMADVLVYARDKYLDTNQIVGNYLEVYKMIKVGGVWKVHGNQTPVEIEAMPTKFKYASTEETGYDLSGRYNYSGDLFKVSFVDPHFSGYTNIALTEAVYNGYEHLMIPAGPAKASCAANSVHCQNYFKMPNGIRRPNFLKVSMEYTSGLDSSVSNHSLMIPSYKDTTDHHLYPEFVGLPAPICGASISPASFDKMEVSLPTNYVIQGWSVGPTSSTGNWIDYNQLYQEEGETTIPHFNLVYENGLDALFSQFHASIYTLDVSGVRHVTGVSCGYP